MLMIPTGIVAAMDSAQGVARDVTLAQLDIVDLHSHTNALIVVIDRYR